MIAGARNLAGMGKVNLDEKLALFSEHWAPKLVGTVNDYDVKVVRLDGEFVRHRHDDTDELFLVLEGELTIYLPADQEPDGEVTLGPHDMYVVSKGVEHRPVARPGTAALLVEPSGVVNTGDADDSGTTEAEPI